MLKLILLFTLVGLFCRRSKKEITKDKQERRLTGGGPPPKPIDDLSQMVYNMIPQQFDPLDNIFNDDANVCLLQIIAAEPLTKEMRGMYNTHCYGCVTFKHGFSAKLNNGLLF